MAVRYGSRSTAGPPGVTYAVGISCRRVPQTRLSQGQFDFTLANAWLTQDTVALNPPSVISPWLGAIFTDQFTADEVSFDDAPGDWWSVCRREEMNPYVGPDYYRDLLIPVHRLDYPWWLPPSPLPGPPVPGGLTYVPPGGSCADPRVLTAFGDYLWSTQLNGTNGYYAFVFSPGESVRFSYIGGVSAIVASDVFLTDVHGNGCAGAYQGQISPAGVACVSVTPSGLPPAQKFVISVASYVPPWGEFRTIGVRIENAVC